MDTETKTKSKKPTLFLANAGPQDRVSVLSTKCEGYQPKALIVASSYKIKRIIITTLTVICQNQFSFLLDKNKN